MPEKHTTPAAKRPSLLSEEEKISKLPSFLRRGYKLLEGLKEKPLRRMLREVGLSEDQVASFRSLKLLATLLQLCATSVETGLSLDEHRAEVASRWVDDARLDALQPLFALVDLRMAASHSLGTKEPEKVRTALKVYGLDENIMTAGWGLAVDQIYDRLTMSLNELISIVRACRFES